MTRPHELTPSQNIISLKKIIMIDEKPSRICGGCGATLLYKTLKGYESAVKQNNQCKACAAKENLANPILVPKDLRRYCPTCNTYIDYKSRKCYVQAERSKRRCRSCSDQATRETTNSPEWIAAQSKTLKESWAKLDSIFKTSEYRESLSDSQKTRIDNRTPGALKAAQTRKANGSQDQITIATHTPAANAKRRRVHLDLRQTNPELWQTDKAKAGWVISGEKGKGYIDKAIEAARVNGKRSIFEMSFEEPLKSLGFVPTQQVGHWWVDYANHSTKVIVECYGDWYHCHPKFDKRIGKLYQGIQPEVKLTPAAKRAKDLLRVQNLESLGYSVIVIWQHDSRHFLSWISSSKELASNLDEVI